MSNFQVYVGAYVRIFFTQEKLRTMAEHEELRGTYLPSCDAFGQRQLLKKLTILLLENLQMGLSVDDIELLLSGGSAMDLRRGCMEAGHVPGPAWRLLPILQRIAKNYAASFESPEAKQADRIAGEIAICSIGIIMRRSRSGSRPDALVVEDEAIRFLIDLLNNRNKEVVHLAIFSLALTGKRAERAVPSVVKLVESANSDELVRKRAFQFASQVVPDHLHDDPWASIAHELPEVQGRWEMNRIVAKYPTSSQKK